LPIRRAIAARPRVLDRSKCKDGCGMAQALEIPTGRFRHSGNGPPTGRPSLLLADFPDHRPRPAPTLRLARILPIWVCNRPAASTDISSRITSLHRIPTTRPALGTASDPRLIYPDRFDKIPASAVWHLLTTLARFAAARHLYGARFRQRKKPGRNGRAFRFELGAEFQRAVVIFATRPSNGLKACLARSV
jgi:hypothetical protein